MAMFCPICEAWTTVLDTRQGRHGPRRRYECGNKHRFSTIEVLAVLIKHEDKKEKLKEKKP